MRKFQQVSVACKSQVLGRQVSASSVSKFSKSQVSASLGKISIAKFEQVSACSVSKFGKSQRSESVHKMFVSRGAWRSDSILSQGSQGLVFESGKVRGSRLSPRGGHGLDFLSQGVVMGSISSQGRSQAHV